MCGFVGIVQRDGRPVPLALLQRMARTIGHRGPDDEGHLVVGPVGLYAKRLSIIDLATGHQPMTLGDATIVFNGEIYNYVELRESLKRRGHDFRTTSDTEVILHAYHAYGLDFACHLNGIFGLALYDAAARRLVLARDHLGVKPLYVHASEHLVAFASEIKALLRHPAIRARLDPDALQDYLTLQFVLEDRTLFAGIQRVLPGHLVVLDLDTYDARALRFWEPRFVVDTAGGEEALVAELRHLLHDAVRIQMRSDVPVGCYLSGGMDSTLVTMMAAAASSARLKTFTGVFADPPSFDESAYARAVAEACGAEPFEVRPTQRQFVDLMPTIVYHLDEPCAGPGAFPQYLVSQLAGSHVKVVLGGQGGDEVFGGYARYLVAYLEQALKGAIFDTNEEQEHVVSLQSIVANLPVLHEYVPMLRRFWSEELFAPMDRRYFRLIDRSEGSMDLLAGDFRLAFNREEVFARFQRIFNHPDTRSYYNKMTHFDLVCGLPALLQVEDRMSMAASVESRAPLLDHRIVDLVGRMPPRLKFRGGALKASLRRAVGDLLPPIVAARRDKMGFPVPLHIWMDGEVGDFCRDTLLSRAARNRGLFDPAAVARLLAGQGAFDRRLWGLLNLEIWFSTFLDGSGHQEAECR